MGTGGTISGVGRYLHRAAKAKGKKRVQVIGVDTVGSVYTEFKRSGKFPKDIHQYLIDGIGEDFMPSTVWWDEIDDVVQVSDEDAYLMQARLAREEAIFSGSSAGAAVHGALQVANRLPASSLVVTLLPDTGERYLSKFNVEWMESKGLRKAPAYLKRKSQAASIAQKRGSSTPSSKSAKSAAGSGRGR
jgi:cystathionine beta-synthase